jgi:hypothetical protein
MTRELTDAELDVVAGGAGHGTFTPPPPPTITVININDNIGIQVNGGATFNVGVHFGHSPS